MRLGQAALTVQTAGVGREGVAQDSDAPGTAVWTRSFRPTVLRGEDAAIRAPRSPSYPHRETMPALTCPNCSETMDRQTMDGVLGSKIDVDLCFACHTLWLDKRESLQLSPRGTIDLFKVLHEHRDDPRHALEGRMSCPHCGRRLSLHQDIGKAGRFSYYACPAGDGRLTPFSEFLKEKQFVRTLTPVEKNRLRAEVKNVQCSSCGAPVDLAKGFQCGHCASPITVLDAEAVEKTLRDLSAADQELNRGDPAEKEMRARALASLETMRSHPDERWEASELGRLRSTGSSLGIDILSASIGFIFGRY